MLKLLVLSLACLHVTEGRIWFGSCPKDLKMIDNFDPYRYVGKWYEIARDYTNPFTYFSMCTTQEFGQVKPDGSFDQNYRRLYWPIFWHRDFDGVYYQCGGDPTR